MNAREQGFLLLTSHLGDPKRRPLTTAQLRLLSRRARAMDMPLNDRHMVAKDLMALGYGREDAQWLLMLLQDWELLDYYLYKARTAGCVPVTRVSEAYPAVLRQKLGDESSGCLWAKGDLGLLSRPAVSLVGSRDLRADNSRFACEAGIQAARQGYVLVSGNARGADRTAQQACLDAGGSVICVVADELERQQWHERVLYLSEDGFCEPFSAQRALSRNRIIHCLGQMTFVAQSHLRSGGTWDGTQKNLRCGWSDVFCFADGSQASVALCQMGASPVTMEQLRDLSTLRTDMSSLFIE